MDSIKSGIVQIGERGPGPRSLVRFVAGSPCEKDEFSHSELKAYAEVGATSCEHFQKRFNVEGRVQAYFQECEAFKCIDDIFMANRKAYVPFSGSDADCQDEENMLDRIINRPEAIRNRLWGSARALFTRYPWLLVRLQLERPRQASLSP